MVRNRLKSNSEIDSLQIQNCKNHLSCIENIQRKRLKDLKDGKSKTFIIIELKIRGHYYEKIDYTVVVKYKSGNLQPPNVFIKELEEHNQVLPHTFKDGCLCLFKPKEFQWKKSIQIYNTIIPWTVLWIYFFELWCEYGIWLGDEAEHLENEPKDSI